MKDKNWVFLCFVVIFVFALTVSFGCKKDVEELGEEDEMGEAEETEMELPVAAVFQKVATEGIKILRLERAEVHSEIVMEGETGTLVKLDSFKYLYEVELIKDGQTGEIEVDAEGNITEELKWDSK